MNKTAKDKELKRIDARIKSDRIRYKRVMNFKPQTIEKKKQQCKLICFLIIIETYDRIEFNNVLSQPIKPA